MRTIVKILIWFVVIGVLALLYKNSRSVHLSDHEHVSATLETLKEQDALIDQHLLRARYYALRTYDPLNRALDRIERSLNYLERGAVKDYRLSQPSFDQAFQRYKQLFGKRKELVERFKSSNSILRNSLHHIARSARRVERGVAADDAALVQAALRDVLLYNQTGDVALAQAARGHHRTLEERRALASTPADAGGDGGGASADIDTEIVILGRHIANILTRKPEVDGLIEMAIQAPSLEMGDAIYRRYTESYIDAAHRADIYRLLLFALAASLLLYIGLAIVKLKLANWLLGRANLHLEQLNEAAQRFVPHEFLDHMGRRDLADVKLGDHRPSTMTVFFSDIRSFTSISEKLSPGENFDFINDYLQEMGPIIREHQGFIDKYIGDAIMALFDGDADRAVRASLAMLRSLRESNERRTRAGMQSIHIGIGLHTGDVMLGTVGEHGRMESTVISDAVNLAARLESLTKHYGVPLLISKATYQALRERADLHVRYIDRVKVKGKEIPVEIYEVFDADEPEVRALKEQTAETLRAGVEHLQNGNPEAALRQFDACLEVYPDDLVAEAHRQSILIVTRTTLRKFDQGGV